MRTENTALPQKIGPIHPPRPRMPPCVVRFWKVVGISSISCFDGLVTQTPPKKSCKCSCCAPSTAPGSFAMCAPCVAGSARSSRRQSLTTVARLVGSVRGRW